MDKKPSERWSNLVEKYGSEEAARAEMRRRSSSSSRNKKGTGGFAHLKKTNPDKFEETTKKGRLNRWNNAKADSN